jgi:hypothetical protein
VTSPISSAVHQPPLPYAGGYPAATPYRLHSKLRRMAAGFHPEAIKRRQARYKLGAGDQAGADPLEAILGRLKKTEAPGEKVENS